MGKWLSRVIEQCESEKKNYQDILGNDTDKTDKTLDSPSYESGWEKCFPVKGDPFWRKGDIRIKITGDELERLKSTKAREEEKES